MTKTVENTKTPEKKELNYKQQAFVDEYIKDNNGKRAAIRAGYSQHTAEVQASQLLSKLKVKQALEAKRQADAELKTFDVHRWIRQTLKLYSQAIAEGKLAVAASLNEQLARHAGAYLADNTQQGQQAASLTAEQTAELKAIASRLTRPLRLAQPADEQAGQPEGKEIAG